MFIIEYAPMKDQDGNKRFVKTGGIFASFIKKPVIICVSLESTAMGTKSFSFFQAPPSKGIYVKSA